MLLTVDIGNSAAKFGFFDGKKLVSKFTVSAGRDYTVEDLSRVVCEPKFTITNAVICSVVPQASGAVRDFIESRFKVEPFFIDNSFDFGLTVKYEPIETLGTDRLVNAFAASAIYGTPIVVCSLGTATTIDAVSELNEYLGGIIAPGIPAMAEALHLKTAGLPLVEIRKPENIIGTTTAVSIRSGIFYGYASLVDGLIRRVSCELASSRPPKIIATGGFANLMTAECEGIDAADENLLLEGLRLAFEKIQL